MTEARHTLHAFAVLLLAVCSGAGCGGSKQEQGTTPTGDATEGFDDAGFIAGCREGCGADESLCGRFCECSLDEIHRSPELARAVVAAGSEDADPTAVEAMQAHFLSACGEEFYAHHFIQGCHEGCLEEGIATDVCVERCKCLYSTLRERHPGSEGLGYLSTVYASESLPPEAEAEIRVVGPACGF